MNEQEIADFTRQMNADFDTAYQQLGDLLNARHRHLRALYPDCDWPDVETPYDVEITEAQQKLRAVKETYGEGE